MKHRILLMGAALAAFTPSLAHAQDCERQRSGRVAATVGGAAVGALGGAVIAGRGDDAEGAIIGGVLGAIAGNQIAKPDNNCKRAYGWFDKQGRWHATGVSSADARGYYNRDGDWVEGAPNGYYENGRWVSATSDGYWDRDGHWVPANAYGYYDRDGRYVTAASSGYWRNGRWIAGPARGYYDSRGRWIEGNPPSGNYGASWSENEQPGYYDSRGRWVAGRTYGYYDSRGRWVSTRNDGDRRSSNNGDRASWTNQPTDIGERISWMRERVQRMENRDRIGSGDERAALVELDRIEAQYDVYMRSGNRLTSREQTAVERSLDRLQQRVMTARQEARRY